MSTRRYTATLAVALFVALAACSQSSGALFISTREPEQRDEKKLVVRRDRTTGESLQDELARKLDVVTQSQAVIAVHEATKEDAKQRSPFTLTVPAAVATSNIDGELLAAVAVDLGVMSLTNAEALALSSGGERKTVPDLEESGLGPNSPQLGTTLFSPGTTGNESSSESGSAESSGVIRGDVGRIVEPNRSGEVTRDGQPIDNEPDISDDAPETGEGLATIEPPSASIPGKSGNDDSAGDSPKSNREDGGKSGDVGAQLSPGDLPEGNPPTDGDPVIAEESHDYSSSSNSDDPGNSGTDPEADKTTGDDNAGKKADPEADKTTGDDNAGKKTDPEADKPTGDDDAGKKTDPEANQPTGDDKSEKKVTGKAKK